MYTYIYSHIHPLLFSNNMLSLLHLPQPSVSFQIRFFFLLFCCTFFVNGNKEFWFWFVKLNAWPNYSFTMWYVVLLHHDDTGLSCCRTNHEKLHSGPIWRLNDQINPGDQSILASCTAQPAYQDWTSGLAALSRDQKFQSVLSLTSDRNWPVCSPWWRVW